MGQKYHLRYKVRKIQPTAVKCNKGLGIPTIWAKSNKTQGNTEQVYMSLTCRDSSTLYYCVSTEQVHIAVICTKLC